MKDGLNERRRKSSLDCGIGLEKTKNTPSRDGIRVCEVLFSTNGLSRRCLVSN